MDVQGVDDGVGADPYGGDREQTNDRRVVEPDLPERLEVGRVHALGVGRHLGGELDDGTLAVVERGQVEEKIEEAVEEKIQDDAEETDPTGDDENDPDRN